MNERRFADNVFHPHARIERRHRVLKDHLHGERISRLARGVAVFTCAAFIENAARAWLHDASHHAAQGRFSAA